MERARAQRLEPAELPEIVSVLADAFFDYPVMRYVLGDRDDYAERLPELVHLFASARVLREEPLFGVRTAEGLLAVGLASYTAAREIPKAFVALREETFARLGDAARARYENFGTIASRFHVSQDHVHLNMIGVRRAWHGHGLARPILDAVHELSASTGWSPCVTLSTELQANLPIYRHFGYEILGNAQVDDAFTTWSMIRRQRDPRPGILVELPEEP